MLWNKNNNAILTSTSIELPKFLKDAKTNSTPEASIVITKAPRGTAKSKGNPKVLKAITSEAPSPEAAASPRV